MKYTPLYIQTDYTFLSSMITIDSLIEFAKKNNLTSLSITDENMYGTMEFYKKCLKNNINPIIGLEIIIDYPIVLYAKNYSGYQNLLKIATIKTERKITFDDLKKYCDDIIAITENENIYKQINSIFETSYRSFSKIEDKKEEYIYMKKILYLEQKEKPYYPYLQAIKNQKLVVSIDEDNTDYYLDLNENLWTKANEDITSLCKIVFPKMENLLPIYPCPNNLTSEEYLTELCFKELKNRKLDAKEYSDRLNYEIDTIKNMGFANYFLIVMDYVHYAKTHDILVGPGRGSAAGSLTSYLLGITDLDPLKYNLLFERFLNPERVTMPDIDIDFEYTKREDIILYCISKYGIKKVAPIITFGTLASKQVIRDVGRCMDIDLKKLDLLTKKLDSKSSLIENYHQNKEIKEMIQSSEELKKLYKVALKFEGMKRHSSIHAAGIVMSKIDLDEIIPLDKSHEKFYTTGYSMEYLEDFGLLKMDFLALKNLTMIKNIIDEIREVKKINLTFDNIEENDSNTLSIFHNVDTVGIFQFESEGMKNFLKKFKPTTFEDIFSAIALYRPGPMGNIDHFIQRKQGKEKIDYYHPDLEEILKPTYGIIVYQEQVMQIAHVLAGYSLGEADLLRRAMSKKKEEILLKEKDKFISRSIQRGYSQELSTKIYNLILKFADYGFPRAHAVAYSMISYKMAYLKYYYPMYFYKHLLNMGITSDKIKDYILECKSKNIRILKPNINNSDKEYKVTKDGILFSLLGIKNIGLIAVEEILKERQNGLFKDVFDFLGRCYSKIVNKEIIQSLIYTGCFDFMGYTRNTLISNLEVLISYAELVKDIGKDYALVPELENKEELPSSILNEKEFELFGCYLGDHPTVKYKNKFKNITPLNDIELFFDKYIFCLVFVEKKKVIKTKKGQKMCFLSVSDEKRVLDATIFPSLYEDNTDIHTGDILLLKVKVERRFNQYQLIIQKLKKVA